MKHHWRIALLIITSLASLSVIGVALGQPHQAHGDPASLGRGLTARLAPVTNPAGIDEPLHLTTAYARSIKNVRQHLRVSPSLPLRIRQVDSHHYLIMPRYFWPAKSLIALSWKGSPASTILHTDNGREIVINLSRQNLTAWENGSVTRTMTISTGLPPRWVTPTGTYWIYKRVEDDHMIGGDPHTPDHWDVDHVPYAQYFNGAIALHGAWWNHHFGQPVSHGCIQLPTAESPSGPTGDPPDALWLWRFADMGTPVIVTGRTPDKTNEAKTPLPYPPDSPVPTPARFGASSNR